MMSFRNIHFYEKIFSAISRNSKSILLYLFFVFISVIFWCFTSFTKPVTIETQVSFQIVDYDTTKIHFIDNAPSEISCTVTMEGKDYLRYLISSKAKVEVKFKDYCNIKRHQFILANSKLSELIGKAIGNGAIVSSCDPLSISLDYTDNPGKKVPVELDSRVEPDFKYTAYGDVTLSQDSVTIYSDSETLDSIESVSTYLVQIKDLTDTLRREVFIKPIKGVKIEPRSIQVMIPIEPLILKKKAVPISLINVPKGIRLIVFPSSVTVSYLAPKSLYKVNNADIKAVVDYNQIDRVSKSNYVAVKVSEAPNSYKNVRIVEDSVEYIIEK